MKTLLFLTITLVFSLCISCDQNPSSAAGSYTYDDSYVYVSDQPELETSWTMETFQGNTEQPSIDHVRDVYDRFEKSLQIMKVRYAANKDAQRRIARITLPSPEEMHANLLKLQGREIDLIGSQHANPIEAEANLDTLKCQKDIVNIIFLENYASVFEETFENVITEQTYVDEVLNDCAMTGTFVLKSQIEDSLRKPRQDCHRITLLQYSLDTTLVGVDNMQILELSTTRELHESLEAPAFNRQAFYVLEALCDMRDLIALANIANSPHYVHGNSALVFGAHHVPHMQSTFIRYGASGRTIVPEFVYTNERFRDLKNKWIPTP